MSKDQTHTVELYHAERLMNSRNGNPRYRLATSLGPFLTQSDAACSYDVDNIARKIPEGGSALVTLRCTPTGRVWGITVREERPS